MHFQDQLDSCFREKKIPKKIYSLLTNFHGSYLEANTKNGYSATSCENMLNTFLDCVVQQVNSPFSFSLYHKAIHTPFDYYKFGCDFMRPLVIFSSSTISGKTSLEKIDALIKRGENVILFANHQTEPDSQAISLLLEEEYPQIAKEMIFIAGQRVLTDPLAIPFSMGINLLSIHAKKYLDTEPEKKQERIEHNRRTIKKLSQLLDEGGKCIFVAPSGGRDRPNSQGVPTVAPFDPQSVELFYLTARHSSKPCHFFPLALSTYHLLPPPVSTKIELGEERHTRATPIHLAFGDAIEMEPVNKAINKKESRKHRAHAIWSLVNDDYKKICEMEQSA